MWFLLPSSLLAFVFFPYSPKCPVPDSSGPHFLLYWTHHLLCALMCFTNFRASMAFPWITEKFSLYFSPLGIFVSPSIPSEVLLSLSLSPCPQNHHHLLCELKWRWKCCVCLAPGWFWVISLPLVLSVCSDLVTATPLTTVTSLQDALELLERIFRTIQI